MNNRWFIVILLGLLSFRADAASPIVISEFMASNTKGLADEDRSFEDWIEVHNVSSNAVNLDGWHLTDATGDLRKWRFPATNLNAGAFLVVFASDKNRRVPGAPLHTNFRLASNGEYLALVEPDGSTIASEFAPAYPAQAPDVSYGFGTLTTNQTLVASNSLVRVRIPTNGDDDTNWTSIAYGDGAWLLGTNGVGYGTTNLPATDYGASVLPTAPVGYWRFSESAGPTATNYGAGGASLNGTYTAATVGSAGPRPPQFRGFEALNRAPTFNGTSGHIVVSNSLLNSRNAFSLGGWIKPSVAPSGRNGLFGQNGCVAFGFLSASTLQCTTPGGGAVEATYSAAVNTWHHVAVVGDGVSLRIFIDGTLAATGGTPTANYGSSSARFHIGGGGILDATGNFFNGQIDEVFVHHRALSDTEVRSLYLAGTNVFAVSVLPFVKTDVGPLMSNVNASAYLRIPFVVNDPTNLTQLTLRMRYDDGFVAFINGVDMVIANAPETLTYNAAATDAHVPREVEEFRFGAEALVVPGTNVLAIQGLNVAADDSDFLITTELLGTRFLGESTIPVYFTKPTPGADNGGGVVAPGPAILESAHTPNLPLDAEDLTVTAQVAPTFAAVSNVVMRYRIMFGTEVEVAMFDDGLHRDGAAGDQVYGATIPASASTNGQMIRWFFRATDVRGNVSRWPLFTDPANTAEYLGTIVDPTNVTSKLPIVHFFVHPNQQSAIDTKPQGGRASVFHDGEFYDNIFMRTRGNTTASYTKKSHRLEFNREHEFRHPGPGGRLRKTSFVADYPDPTYMRQGLAFWLSDLVGAPAPFYYPMRLQMNATFYQLANHNDLHGEELCERLGYDPNGALYNAAGTVVNPTFSTGGFDKKTRTWDTANADYVALAAAIAETLPVNRRMTNLFDLFDVPEIINYLVVARWAHENDDVWANLSLYHDNDGDGLWRIIPFDMNLSWGAIFYEGGTPSVIEGVQATNDIHKAHPLYGFSLTPALSGPGAPNNFNRVYEAFFQVSRTREMFLRRMRTMLDTYVKPPGTPPNSTIIEQKILTWRDLIAEEAARDRTRWGWPAKGGQCNFDPGINITNGVAQMLTDFFQKRRLHFYGKHCVTNRALPIGITKTDNAGIPLAQPANAMILVQSVEVNPSSGNQAQEFICLTNPSPFAVDISDWKLGGGVRFTFKPGTVMPSNSLLYVSPNLVAFKARAAGPRGGQGLFVVGPYQGQLSARGEALTITDDVGRAVASFSYPASPSPAQQFLRVTELMYNPAPLTGNPNAAQEFEYVEVKNVSLTETLDLRGVRFTNGIAFNFTGSAITNLGPGQVVLIVKNFAAFTARYGGSLPVAGQFSGFLDNAGERLTLLDATGEEILDFSYNNSWYPITDGLGLALVIVDAQAEPDAWSSQANWRPGGQAHGTPGVSETTFPTLAPILITEALTRTDTPPPTDSIELFNPTTNDVNLGGWFLTDDFMTPKKYRIPADSIIRAGASLVFNEAQFNSNPGLPPSFALRSDGDEVYLFSGDASTNLTGYVHGFDFGAAENGVSFGRHVTSEGREHFVAQQALTLGSANAGPKVGPIVMAEIMYRPPDEGGTNDNTDDEFVELLNITSGRVALFESSQPTNTWKITGGIDFAFPTNVVLAAGEAVLLVNFDPADTALLAAFRARYGVSPSVQCFGPYQGKLNNDEDDVELKKPVPAANGAVAYVLVDNLSYKDAAPWPPGADGFGLSLQRRDAPAFGNDPANWLAALPTAAQPLAGTGAPPTILSQPSSQEAMAASSVLLSVIATGAAPLRYQWRFDGSPLAGATNATLELTRLALPDGGNYDVLVYNAVGSVLSSNATLTVVVAASILQQPLNVSVFPRTTAQFGVLAYSSSTLAYQWRFNGVNIPDATNATLSVPNVEPNQAGLYSVVVSDRIGPVESEPARLTVLTHPVFTLQPTNRVVVLRTNATNVTFVAAATSSTPLVYQWFFNETNQMREATNATLTLSNVAIFHAGTYHAVATDAYGSETSARASLIAQVPPYIVEQPLSQSVAVGGSATFSVRVTNLATLPISYRWRRGGATVATVLTDSHVSFYTATNLQPGGATNFTVVITNFAERAGFLSSAANVALLVDTDQDGLPDEWESAYGFNANDRNDVNADSDGDSLSNGQEYQAGTDPTNALSYLRIEPPSAGDPYQTLTFYAGSNRTYTVQFKESLTVGRWTRVADIAASPETRLATVVDPYSMTRRRFYRIVTPFQPEPAGAGPVILQSPEPASGSVGDNASLDVTVSGRGPVSYQWRFNGAPLSGETRAVLDLPNAQVSNAGPYAVTVTDARGSATTEPVLLAIQPRITEQPQSQTVRAGETATLRVQAIGAEPLQYRWYHNHRRMPGETNATLTLPHVQADDAGSYSVTVSHLTPARREGISSQPAQLTVLAP